MGRSRFLRVFLVLVVLGLTAGQAWPAQNLIGPNPSAPWQTAHSTHFVIHYELAHRPQAQVALEAAEKVFGPVTQALNWTPAQQTHIVLLGNVDLANGYATPLPFNQMGIFLTPPDFTQDLARGPWLELVLHHEFTHIVHLDKASSAPLALRNIFGRFPLLFPNIFQPRWMIEGLATYSESAPELGIGRLRGPFFEAALRDERKRGFRTLRELNADGRNPPAFNAYLYGAYFFDFMARRYGHDGVRKLVETYSSNLVPFRFYSLPRELTGKTMDVLYAEFIDDLTREVDARAASILNEPPVIGVPFGKPWRDLSSLAIGKGPQAGSVFAVTDDGTTQPRLQRLTADGGATTLARLRPGVRIDVRADGTVLASQLEICDGHDAYFDLYLIPAGGALFGPARLTKCGRFFRAVWSTQGDAMFALKHSAGTQSLVRLDAHGAQEEVLLAGRPDMQWMDLASSPDGKYLALVGKLATGFGLFEFDIVSKSARPLHVDGAFIHSPSYQGTSLYFLSTTGNVFNAWRLTPQGELQRLTHAHTAVTSLGGADERGRLAIAVMENGQAQIRLLDSSAVLQSAMAQAVTPDSAATPASALPLVPAPVVLKDEAPYSALSTLSPRSWFPVLFLDHGTVGVGASCAWM